MWPFTKKLSEQEVKLLSILQNNAVLFGSRALGVATKTSDYDFIAVMNTTIASILNFHNFKDKTPYYNMAFGTFRYSKLLSNCTKVDLIIASVDEVAAIKQLTQTLTTLPKEYYTSKEDRVRCFQAFFVQDLTLLPEALQRYIKTNRPELLI